MDLGRSGDGLFLTDSEDDGDVDPDADFLASKSCIHRENEWADMSGLLGFVYERTTDHNAQD
jgi:hypothetical protein